MAELEILIGGRAFEVACQEGEEHYLQTAAEMLNAEAQSLIAQTGRIPEARMLLMSGLMLADRTAGVEDRLKELEEEIEALRSDNARLKATAETAQRRPAAQTVEVVPAALKDGLLNMAGKAERLAEELEQKAAG
ncbi:cell division protein ZapA [Pseudooceanicola sp. C21-150M6]|uniref:cell division protein ZapA n=1 Tax=Pseudooceanicola sp. C21-150M6 TaxID=3434355 RepID=UPI003D7F78C8